MFFKSLKIELKTAREIDKMRAAGRVVGEILKILSSIIKPGVTTKDIDIFVEKYIRSFKMTPAFLGVRGISSPFPASACVSVNDEVVHGIPSASRVFSEGDIVSVDIGVVCEGYYGDGARTYAVGNACERTSKLIKVTEMSLENGIKQAIEGNRLGDISYAVQETVEKEGFSVVKDFVGHGIGRALHEDPQIPNFGEPKTGVKLVRGMVLAIEPMVNVGSHEVRMLDDDWTIVTKDGSLSAHFEHTVAITEQGHEILTKV